MYTWDYKDKSSDKISLDFIRFRFRWQFGITFLILFKYVYIYICIFFHNSNLLFNSFFFFNNGNRNYNNQLPCFDTGLCFVHK